MAKKIIFVAATVCLLATNGNKAQAWGLWGHSKINRGAVLALPKEMGMFYYNHADYITEEAVAPDIRKYTMHDDVEFPRHYINLEKYNYESVATMPKTMADVKAKYSKDSIGKFGTLPWTIQEVMEKLTNAMRNKNKAEILFLSANLGHYIGDAHMPLHTTIHHDGETAAQAGIHGLWESELPELYGKNYSLWSDVKYIDNVEKATWDIITHSYSLVNEVLYNDKKLRRDKPEIMLYKMATTGQPAKTKWGSPIFTNEYAHVYHELLNGMVEKQMRAALGATASFWYTAWVNAGKPNLTDLDPKYISDRNAKFLQEDLQYWKKGKVTGYKVINEFKPSEEK